jgi:sugar phosphate isomerase/epimerase
MTTISQRSPVQLTLLSSILGGDFPLALERQKALGLRFLDLKDGLWGKSIEQLNKDEALHATALIDAFGLAVHCFSTSAGHTSLEPNTNENAFRTRHQPALENALRVAEIVRPQVIRLLAPRLSPATGETAIARLQREFPWVMGVYRDWVDQIAASGFGILIENEARGCLLGSVTDVQSFFAILDRPAARYTWDVQNLWQSGTFPNLEVYRQLQPLIGAVHLKGGRSDDNQTLKWTAPLDEASWPVLDIVREIVADGVAPFICLNPSHGLKPPDWNDWEVAQHEVAWLRREIKGIE